MNIFQLMILVLLPYVSWAQFEIDKIIDGTPGQCNGEIHIRTIGSSGPFRLDLYDNNSNCLLKSAENVQEGIFIFSDVEGLCAVPGGICAGDYRITVNSVGGCLFELFATVEEKPCDISIVIEDIRNVSYRSNDVSCCAGNPLCQDGVIKFFVEGYRPSVIIEFVEPNGNVYRSQPWTQPGYSLTRTNLATGTYTINVMSLDDVTCELSRTVTVRACEVLAGGSETSSECEVVQSTGDIEIKAQVISALNANDFSGAIYITLPPDIDKESITYYFIGPYDFISDDQSGVEKTYSTSLESLAPGKYSFFLDNGCGEPQQFEYEIVGCKADLEIRAVESVCFQAPFSETDIIVMGGDPGPNGYTIIVEDIIQQGQPDKGGFKVIDAIGCSEYFVLDQRPKIDYFIIQTFDSWDSPGPPSYHANPARISVAIEGGVAPFDAYIDDNLLEKYFEISDNEFQVIIPLTFKDRDPLVLTFVDAIGCTYESIVGIPSCQYDGDPFVFEVQQLSEYDCSTNNHKYRITPIYFDPTKNNTIEIYKTPAEQINPGVYSARDWLERVTSIPYPNDGEELIIDGMPSGRLYFYGVDGCFQYENYHDENCQEDFNCTPIKTTYFKSGKLSIYQLPFLNIQSFKECCDGSNCGSIKFTLWDYAALQKNRLWTGSVRITYRNETRFFEIQEGRILVDGLPITKEEWYWTINESGTYNVKVEYSNGCIFEPVFEKGGTSNRIDVVGYNLDENWIFKAQDPTYKYYTSSFICGDCTLDKDFLSDNNQCRFDNDYRYTYFIWKPNSGADPCYGGGTLQTYRRVGDKVILDREYKVSGDKVIGEHRGGFNLFESQNSVQCTDGGSCILDAFKVFGHKLQYPILAGWCSTFEDYESYWCKAFPDDPGCPPGSGNTSGNQCSSGNPCPDPAQECVNGVCVYPAVNGQCPREDMIVKNGYCYDDSDICEQDCSKVGMDCIKGSCQRPICGFTESRNGDGKDFNQTFTLDGYVSVGDQLRITINTYEEGDRIAIDGEGLSETYHPGCRKTLQGGLYFPIVREITVEDPTKPMYISIQPCDPDSKWDILIECLVPSADVYLASEFSTQSINDRVPRKNEKDFDIYPNPFISDFSILSRSELRQGVEIQIFDALCKIINTADLELMPNSETNVDFLRKRPAGLYTVTLIYENGDQVSKRIIKTNSNERESYD